MDYRTEAPDILKGFLTYHETIKGHSKRTAEEYYLDLRNFFRYMKLSRGLVSVGSRFDEISIADIDLDFVRTINLADVYDYLAFLAHDRERSRNSREKDYGVGASTRARKIAAIRSYFKYMTSKANLLTDNPVKDLDSPKIKKALPRYLSLDESIKLLSSVDGANKERDYCILTIFLNCGLRISELVGLNLSDIRSDNLRVLGKGNKERVVYLNDACVSAINDYLAVRKSVPTTEKRAFFLSSRRTRISRSTVHELVKKHLSASGLDASKYSSHKLRHTAATLMLHNGVDVRTLQELLGHEHLNTTEIYTHVESGGLRKAAQLNPLAAVKTEKKNISED